MLRLVPGRLVAFACFLLSAFATDPARAQISQNVIFHARLDEHPQYADIWGYTAPNGDEYALVCTSVGLSVVNVTDPKNPYETGLVSGPVSTWRDVKTYQTWAYVTNENGEGLEIVDLSDPENPVGLTNYTGFDTAHNLYIDTTTARCYIAGSDVGSGGVRVLSLANPTAPTEVGSWETAYFHDVYVQNDVLYGSAIYDDTLYLLDVASPGSISVLGSHGNYPNAFTHNAWATADGNHVMTTDELVGSACRMWDVSDPSNITQTDLYLPNAGTVPHNAHIEGDVAFISHYTIGVRFLDISNRFNLTEVGWYDTWPPDDSGNFRGCWGVYPFFQTNPDLVVASDFNQGLYVLEFKGPLGTLAGEITESGNPTVKISQANIEILDTGNFASPDVAGQYAIEDVPGAVAVEVSAYGYQTVTTGATIVAGTVTTLDVSLVPVAGGSISGTVTDAGSSTPVIGASVEIVSTPLLQSTDGLGNYVHASLPSGTHLVRAHAFGYAAMEAVVTTSPGSTFPVDFPLNPALVADEFEAGGAGWTLSGSATGGVWEIGDPEPTVDHLGTVQTGDDHTPGPGVNCWVTGRLGGGLNDNDVDNGATFLTSPVYDVSGLANPRFSFWLWYVAGTLFNPTTDTFFVSLSDDGGANWTQVLLVALTNREWTHYDFAIADFVTPNDQLRLRFRARDVGSPSTIEAAIDDLTIYGTEVAPPTDAPGIEPGADLVLALGPSAPNPVRAGQVATLAFSLPTDGPVSAGVYDVAGHRIATLEVGVLPAGHHHLVWDGRASSGRPVAAGVYFVRLEAETGARSRKVLVIR